MEETKNLRMKISEIVAFRVSINWSKSFSQIYHEKNMCYKQTRKEQQYKSYKSEEDKGHL